MRDYYTRDEFLTYTGDDMTRYPEADIDAAQEVVIDYLERWALSAWPNVDDTATTDDGWSLIPRTVTETFDGGETLFLLEYHPVLAVTTITVGASEFSSDSYFLYPEGAYIRVPNSIGEVPRTMVVTYDYGFLTCPAAIKRAAMHAAKEYLDLGSSKGLTAVPPNVRSYTTERTTFDFRDMGIEKEPWPWDLTAFQWMETYWGPTRARVLTAI